MAIAKADNGQTSERVAARVRRCIGIDEVWGNATVQGTVFGNRRHIARIPPSLLGCVGPQEATVRFARAQEASHANAASCLSLQARRWMAALGGDKAAVDQDDALVCRKWRHDPKAWPVFSHRLDKDLSVMAKDAFRRHAGICVVRRPDGPCRSLDGRTPETGLGRHDQVALPMQPLDLPCAKRGEPDGQRQAQTQEGRADQAPPAATGGGAVGIMFPCRWNMIHSDPKITISTMMAVNTSATSVHPPSERVFTWRK